MAHLYLLSADAMQKMVDASEASAAVKERLHFSVMQWVDAIAEVAESMDHHPDIDVRWVKLRVSVMTHDKGGLTALDFELADRVDAICT